MEITKKELAEMYESMPTAEIMEKLGGINKARFYSLLKSAGIPTHREYKPRKIIKLVD